MGVGLKAGLDIQLQEHNSQLFDFITTGDRGGGPLNGYQHSATISQQFQKQSSRPSTIENYCNSILNVARGYLSKCTVDIAELFKGTVSREFCFN